MARVCLALITLSVLVDQSERKQLEISRRSRANHFQKGNRPLPRLTHRLRAYIIHFSSLAGQAFDFQPTLLQQSAILTSLPISIRLYTDDISILKVHLGRFLSAASCEPSLIQAPRLRSNSRPQAAVPPHIARADSELSAWLDKIRLL